MVLTCVGTGETRPGLNGQPKYSQEKSRYYIPPDNVVWTRRYLYDRDPEEWIVPRDYEGAMREFCAETYDEAMMMLGDVTWSRRNEGIMRNFHPGLSNAKVVSIRRNENSRFIWIAEGVPWAPTSHGIDRILIHVRPWCYVMPTPLRIHCDLWSRETRYDPQHILHSDEVHSLRSAFPNSVGVHVMLCGLMIMQYRSYEDIQADWNHGVPYHFRGLAITFNVLSIRASTGQKMLSSNHVALGLRLKMLDGKHVVTTWTTDLIRTKALKPPVKQPPKTMGERLKDWWNTKKTQEPQEEITVGTVGDKHARVMKVWDKPFSGIFPNGYQHGLSFLKPHEDSQLPSMVRLLSYPNLKGFSGIQHALHTGNIFLAGSGIDTRRLGARRPFIIDETGEAAVQGTQYYWGDKEYQERESNKGKTLPPYSTALLWTVPREGEDYANPDKGKSPVIVCEGMATGGSAHVVVMKNFEVD